jgi:hypothetical protein
VSYESDCTTSLSAGQVAPFVSTTNIDTTTGTTNVLPQGAKFGVAGAVSQTIIGPIIAGVNAQLNPATIGLTVSETFGSTDGNATGTSAYSHSFTAVANPGGQVTATAYGSGVTTIPGNFSALTTAGDALSGTGIASNAVTTAPGTATGVTISVATTAASTGGAVGWAPEAGQTFTDTSFASTATAFTTAAPATLVTGSAGIGVTSTTEFGLVTPSLTIPFGGTSGTGTANCLETGWVNATTPGPSQTGATSPQLPPGTTTPLLTATPTFQSGAYANLLEPAPTAGSESISMAEGQTGLVITLPTTPGNPVYPVASCALSGTPSAGLTVTISNSPTVCQATLSNTDTTPSSATFQFTATDDYGTPQTSSAGTVTVNIGTAPVDQPIEQQVNAGQLVLSCSAPGSTGYPLLTCPLITLPAITLNGTTQTSTAPANTIYVSDSRGDPTAGWTLTTYMVATSPTLNTNTSCAGVVAFCDSSVSTHATSPNGQIPGADLAVAAPTCAPATGNLNPAPTAGAGGTYASTETLCTAAAGQSGGTFSMNTSFTLTVPASNYAGIYYGTVEYLVS